MIANPDQVSNATIQTFSGHMFDIFNPNLDHIVSTDIAHALSMICRYGGHAIEFYSVAEHSVLMSNYFKDQGLDDLAFAALFHDATEAYMGDMVRPLKFEMQFYRDTEGMLQRVIFHRFGLPLDMPWEIKDADLRITGDERNAVMLRREWSTDNLPLLGVPVYCWSPREAEEHWLEAFNNLSS